MIYLVSNNNLTSNIILPKEECIDVLRSFRNELINDKEKKNSFSVIDMAFCDREMQMGKVFNLSSFLIDNNMLPVLYDAFNKLHPDYAYYVLEKISSDYDFFVNNIYDKIKFDKINSFSIDELRTAHRINADFGIEDDYSRLLAQVEKADMNTIVLNLARKIRRKGNDK